MKILVLSDGDEYSVGWSYKRAFEAIGHSVILLNPALGLARDWRWRSRLTRRVFERTIIERFNAIWVNRILEHSVDVIWVGKGAWATPGLWRAIKAARPETTLVCFNGDDPITTFSRGGNRPWVTESIPCFDLFCTYKKELLRPLSHAGARRVMWLPFAWDSHIHPSPDPYVERYDYDLVFVGNGDQLRGTWLRTILNSREASNWKVGVFGHWKLADSSGFSHFLHHKQVVGADMANIISRSRLSLNILRTQNLGTHNMRTFEIPGAGGLMASQSSDEQENWFPNKVGAVYFSDRKRAAGILNEIINDGAALERMRTAAARLVQSHTYEERAEALIKEL